MKPAKRTLCARVACVAALLLTMCACAPTRDRIDAAYLALSDKIDLQHNQLLTKLDRQGENFERRLDRLESNLARLDERTSI